MPLEPHWYFSEWLHTHSQWQNASLSGQHECDSGGLTLWMMNCVLCGWSAPQWAVLFKLTTSLCSYMTKLSYPYPGQGKAGRRMRVNCSGQRVPLIHYGERSFGNLVSSMKAWTDWIPFETLLFEAAKHSGSAGGHGGSEEETERER